MLPQALDEFAGNVALVTFVWQRRCIRHGDGKQQECDGAARGQPQVQHPTRVSRILVDSSVVIINSTQPQVLQPQPWHRGKPKA